MQDGRCSLSSHETVLRPPVLGHPRASRSAFSVSAVRVRGDAPPDGRQSLSLPGQGSPAVRLEATSQALVSAPVEACATLSMGVECTCGRRSFFLA